MSKDLLGSAVRSAVGVPQNRLELLAKLASKMSSENPEGQGWHDHLCGVLKIGLPHIEELLKEIPKPTVYLERLYVGKKIIIGPTDGKRTIAQAKDVFTGSIDSDFGKLDVSAPPTGEAECAVFGQVNNGTFAEVFGIDGRSPEQLCYTQHQIIDFCVVHKDKLSTDGYGTCFLFQVGEKFFVVHVCVGRFGCLGRLDVLVYSGHSLRDSVRDARYHYRFVTPKLAPVVT